MTCAAPLMVDLSLSDYAHGVQNICSFLGATFSRTQHGHCRESWQEGGSGQGKMLFSMAL